MRRHRWRTTGICAVSARRIWRCVQCGMRGSSSNVVVSDDVLDGAPPRGGGVIICRGPLDCDRALPLQPGSPGVGELRLDPGLRWRTR